MKTKERYADNNGIKLHYLQGNGEVRTDKTPVFHIPGGMGGAEWLEPNFHRFGARAVYAMSQRGRGKSGVPETGYAFETLVEDAERVIEDTGLEQIFLFAFSLGVPTALGYAVRHPEKIKGLIIADHPARYPDYGPEWTEKFKGLEPGLVHMQGVYGVQRESREVLLWDELSVLTCPVLIIRGGLEGAVLSPTDAERYLEKLPQAELLVFENSTHRLWEPSEDHFFNVIREFVERHDR